MDPLIYFALFEAVVFCILVVYIVRAIPRKEEREAVHTCTALIEKIDVWWNLQEDEWKESFDTQETKELFGATIAAYQHLTTRYPRHLTEEVKNYIRIVVLLESWCNLVNGLVEMQQKIAETKLEPFRKIQRLGCEIMIGCAIAMNKAVLGKYPQLNKYAQWYQDILMERYHIIVEDRLPPEKEDLH